MIIVDGKSAYGGIAIGPIRELVKENKLAGRKQIEDIDGELARFEAAKEQAAEELRHLYEKALPQVGEEHAAIFEAYQMMLQDDDYCNSVRNIIASQQVNAEYAVDATGENFKEFFSTMEDEYTKARAVDVKDISERLIRVLQGAKEDIGEGEEAAIILADDLTPSETIHLGRSRVLAFVTRKGSTNSHAAILARTMNITALVCTPAVEGLHGKQAIVDGKEGKLIVEPDEETLETYRRKRKEEQRRQERLTALKNKKTQTKSGKEIRLFANIGGVADVDAALMNGAEGIGLFRSEFLYLEKKDYPSEEEQFQAYREAAEKMAGKQVIIRTMDIGADKQLHYFKLDKEENPALGYRAVRICLDYPKLFKTQLRALYRASAYGNIAIIIPMIISLWEVLKVKEMIEEVKAELREESIPFGQPKFGIMIETPAAVMIADELAREVDFFSIGTNDLTQYTLAIDRQNQKLEPFYDAHHPAILKMIQMIVDSAHKAGIRVGICGELGGDTELTEKFVNMGMDELSVPPAMVLPVRERVVEME